MVLIEFELEVRVMLGVRIDCLAVWALHTINAKEYSPIFTAVSQARSVRSLWCHVNFVHTSICSILHYHSSCYYYEFETRWNAILHGKLYNIFFVPSSTTT